MTLMRVVQRATVGRPGTKQLLRPAARHITAHTPQHVTLETDYISSIHSTGSAPILKTNELHVQNSL